MKKFRNLTLGAGYLLVICSLMIWARSFDPWQIRQQLQWISPLWLTLNGFLIVAALVWNLPLFRQIAHDLPKRAWILALAMACAGTLLTMLAAPRTHRIYYDEDIYLNIGQNIAYLNQAAMCNEGRHLYGVYQCSQFEYNKEPNGWPFLLSLVFRAAGPSHLAGFLLNNIFWGLSGLMVFFLGWQLFGSTLAGMFGAFLFMLMPEGLKWSNTAAVEPAAAFFAGLALLAALVFARHPGRRSLFLAAVILPFAFQFRPETGMIAAPVSMCLLFLAPKEFTKFRFYAAALLMLALALPHLMHLYVVRGEGWGVPAGTAKLALQHLTTNFGPNSVFYVNNARFPVLTTLLFVIGIGLSLTPCSRYIRDTPAAVPQRAFRKESLIILVWLVLFWGIFLFFYAGSYNYGVDVRFSLLSYIPLSTLAGVGAAGLSAWCRERLRIDRARTLIIVLILMSFLSFLPYIRALTQEAWNCRADHAFAEIMARQLPAHALILTHNPNMFLLWGKNAAQASLATYNPEYLKQIAGQYPDGIYFHYNYWCVIPDAVQNGFCDNILNQIASTEILTFQERGVTFRLHKLVVP